MSAKQEYSHKLGTGLEAFQASGLLWALNTHVLHGAGFEARIVGDEVVLLGYREKVRQWTPDQAAAADERWRAYRQTLLDAEKFNNPSYHEGHSPGFGLDPKLAPK